MMNAASVVPPGDPTAWIVESRPPRVAVDPFKPYGCFLEQERNGDGRVVDSAVLLLTNKECPWRCLMCDLWKNTLASRVPPGAIPRQIDHALAQLGVEPEQVKLYNSGSFFDPGAIPPEDHPAIAGRVSFAARVVVESHPRLVGERVLQFRDRISGTLEVAMGLETVHPGVLPRLNKKFDLDDFASAARFLRDHNIAMRAFVLVKPPFMDEAEGLEWAVKSAEFAFACGASVVALIPTRGGNGAMERLRASGEFSPPRLSTLERAMEIGLEVAGGGRVFADTWDLEQFSRCQDCLEPRRQRIHAMNLNQRLHPPVECGTCGGS